MPEQPNAQSNASASGGGSPTLSDSSIAPWGGEAETRWHHFQRMESLGRLAVSVAHEFNNLLTVIGGSVEMLRERMLQTEDTAEIREIRKAVDRAAGLTQQLLSFGHNRSALVQPVDLAWVLKGMAHAILCLTGTRVAVEWKLPTSPCPLRIDPHEVEQVVLNLVINACDAIPAAGRIHVEISPVELACEVLHQHGSLPAGRYARLSVADNGCGMERETQRRLFEPFYTTKEPGKGTGLGMAIVWDILQRTGGHVIVQTEPGQGARFDLYWPFLQL